ncbi:MAG: OB-fold domain-containing protein [Phenylobacterium sp.]|nr:MAG: OB-fold domain-containing protein [Phenylobacterium sp.]
MVAEGLVSGLGDDARLLGGRRRADGKVVFPLPLGAGAEAYDAIELPREGTLWSYTVQRFRPKPPYAGPGDDRSFTPYAVGYVALPDAIIVETRIETDAIDRLRIGMPMTFTLQTFRTDADGAEVLTYAFRPSKEGDAP